MKTVVKCITPRRVVDGWGFEITFRRPQDIIPGRHYLIQNRSIIRELKTQEEIMAGSKHLNLLSPGSYEYKKC